jgi:uncharacterized protein YggU (UPF0235/DUF167 family)
MQLTIHVRPNASRATVGGAHDGALVVKVVEPAEGGRATAAALRAVAAALDVPKGNVVLVRGAASRRKVIDVDVPDSLRASVQLHLARLGIGADAVPDAPVRGPPAVP